MKAGCQPAKSTKPRSRLPRFVKKALALTEEDTEGVLDQSSNVEGVKTGTPTPKAAAALYNERSTKGYQKGLSGYATSNNVNDFVPLRTNLPTQ